MVPKPTSQTQPLGKSLRKMQMLSLGWKPTCFVFFSPSGFLKARVPICGAAVRSRARDLVYLGYIHPCRDLDSLIAGLILLTNTRVFKPLINLKKA